MHNDNIVNNVHLMSKVLEVKVTYTSAVPAVLWDVMSMKRHLDLRVEE